MEAGHHVHGTVKPMVMSPCRMWQGGGGACWLLPSPVTGQVFPPAGRKQVYVHCRGWGVGARGGYAHATATTATVLSRLPPFRPADVAAKVQTQLSFIYESVIPCRP